MATITCGAMQRGYGVCDYARITDGEEKFLVKAYTNNKSRFSRDNTGTDLSYDELKEVCRRFRKLTKAGEKPTPKNLNLKRGRIAGKNSQLRQERGRWTKTFILEVKV